MPSYKPEVYISWDNYVKEQERFLTGWINNDFDSLVDRVKDLEEWKSAHIEWYDIDHLRNKVKDLEEWKDGEVDKRITLLEDGTDGDRYNINNILSRLAKLEERRQNQLTWESNSGLVVIDKKVWEEITQQIERLANSAVQHSPFSVNEVYHRLKEAIKKAEGSND